MQTLLQGFGLYDLGLFLLRVATGLFFVSYRFRWVYDPTQPHPWFSAFRKEKLLNRLRTCGYPANQFVAGIVALGEIAAGLGLIVGFLTVPSAVLIFVVMVFANFCTPAEEIADMKPVDCIDVFACYMRLVEPLYLLIALTIVLAGPGRWSVDAVILRALS